MTFPVPPISTKEFQARLFAMTAMTLSLTMLAHQTEISFRTIKDAPELRIEFPVPDQQALWRSKVGVFVLVRLHYLIFFNNSPELISRTSSATRARFLASPRSRSLGGPAP